LAQIAVRLAALKGRGKEAKYLEQGLGQVPQLMENILAREGVVREVAQEVVARQRRVYYVGAGPNAVTAAERGVKAKKEAYVTAEGFELEQAIHGPQVAFESEDLLIPISVKGPAQARLADFLLVLSEIGPRVFLIGEAPTGETDELFKRDGWVHFAVCDT